MADAGKFLVEPRAAGKGKAKAFRRNNKIPAVIYGPKMETLPCLVDELFVQKHSHSRFESAIFETQSNDKGLNSLKVMIKKIQRHPVSTRPEHIDLYALDMAATIRVNVPFKFVGTPAGVKEEGGVIQVVLRDVEIECNPSDIPESIELDISGVQLNDSLHVSDVTFPAGVKAMTAGDRTIMTVSIPKEEKEEPAAAAVGAEAAPAEAKKAE